MKLYGSLTSPYVRRVRVVAAELGVSVDFVDSTTEAGAQAVRNATPIWKIPVATLDEQTIWDSAAINDHLLRTRGLGALRAPSDLVRETNLRNAIDGVLDAQIQRMYLAREGVDVDSVPYLVKQKERVASGFAFIASQLDDGRFQADDGFGIVDVALATTLEWFVFRNAFPVAQHPALVRAIERWEARPSMVSTRPV